MRRITIVFLCFLLGACGEREIDPGAGYKYVQLDGTNWVITDRDNYDVVHPNVIRCKVIDSYIVGERVDAKIDQRFSKKFGYFIFDTRIQQLVEGLSKSAFEATLRALHLNFEPFPATISSSLFRDCGEVKRR
jgi:hypothetical protein